MRFWPVSGEKPKATTARHASSSLLLPGLTSLTICARLDLDPVQAAVNSATAAMMEAGDVKEAAEVVQLPNRGAA
ncbi:MAG TPA: hypothetical protein PKM96_06250 [Accumulibacter sp.]|nr:hypothetical protein [Accumulibacter sp.]